MKEHKINVGDKVRVIDNTSFHEFKIGSEVDVYLKHIEGFTCTDGQVYWFLCSYDIQPIPEHTFDGYAVFDKDGRIVKYSISHKQILSKTSLAGSWERLQELGFTCKPVTVTVTVKIKDDE